MTDPKPVETYDINDEYYYHGRFFECGENFTTEQLYQAFKKRFIEEVRRAISDILMEDVHD